MLERLLHGLAKGRVANLRGLVVALTVVADIEEGWYAPDDTKHCFFHTRGPEPMGMSGETSHVEVRDVPGGPDARPRP